MQSIFSKALSKAISNHIDLSETRRETLSWLALLIMQHGTICLWRLAAYVSTSAQTDSVRRRFYRFFQHVKLDGSMAARVVVDMLGLAGKSWVLAIDRTNWDFGKTTINILMISVMWNGMGIPLIWSLLPKAGNSNVGERTCLLDLLQETFPDMQIASIMGDREFIGDKWMGYLKRNKITFIMRIRENQYVTRRGYKSWTIAEIAQHLRRKKRYVIKGPCRFGAALHEDQTWVRIVIMRLPTGELLSLACSGDPHRALKDYRRRWSIETMFGNFKTKGFNLEDTHITDPEKLSTLLAVLALAVALSVKNGVALARLNPIPVKKHGRKAWSLFAPGLHGLRKIFARSSLNQIFAFLRQLFSPYLPLISLQKMGF